MRDVYTYSDLKTLKNAPYYKELVEMPVFTVSSKMKDLFVENGVFRKVETINRVISKIAPDWLSDTSKFNDMALISNYIKILIEADTENSLWLKGCYKEPYNIWSDIMLLEEAELDPSMLQITDNNIRLMVDIWYYIYEKSDSIRKFRKQMSDYKDPERMRHLLKGLFDSDNVGTIVISGMFYITPIQERVLRLMENAGVRLLFLIPYSTKYSKVCRIWEKTYSEETGYPKMDKWHYFETPVDNSLGDLFEDNDATASNLTFAEYKSNIDFVRDIENRKGKVHLYSTDPDAVKELLGDYYPKEFGHKTLISYPIGRYIYTLHDMWDPENERLVLSADMLQECFASGWIPAAGYKSNDYLKDLLNLEVFFKDCITVEEWNDRLSYLWSIHQNIISNFESGSEDETVRRWENILGNPFSNFSFFSVETERLQAVKNLIESLIESAEVLFTKNSRINIIDHIDKLVDLIESNDDLSDIQKEERSVVESILKKIGRESHETSFLPSDISNAMKYFLSNARDETEDGFSKLTVSPLYELCGSQMESENIHICFSDLKRLPGSNNNYVWPLTDVCIDRTCENVAANAPIRYLKHLINETPDNNKYWLYEGLFNKDVTISWISNSRGKMMVCSPYINLLSDKYGLPVLQMEKNKISARDIEQVKCRNDIMSNIEFNEDEMLIDEKLKITECPLSYVYGYILNKSPTFRSEFHLGYVAENFIGSLIAVYGDDHRRAVEDNLFAVLPYLRKIEKRQIRDKVFVDKSGIFTKYRDKEYSDNRLNILFLGRKPGLGDIEYDSVDVQNGLKSIIKDKCMYCPHKDECIAETIGVNADEM